MSLSGGDAQTFVSNGNETDGQGRTAVHRHVSWHGAETVTCCDVHCVTNRGTRRRESWLFFFFFFFLLIRYLQVRICSKEKCCDKADGDSRKEQHRPIITLIVALQSVTDMLVATDIHTNTTSSRPSFLYLLSCDLFRQFPSTFFRYINGKVCCGRRP